jgi:peptidyl-prolyl cis-trans isomerase SurA
MPVSNRRGRLQRLSESSHVNREIKVPSSQVIRLQAIRNAADPTARLPRKMGPRPWVAAFALSLLALLAGALIVGSAACHRSHSADALASVNGRTISREEVQKYYRNQTQGSPQSPSDEQAQMLRLNILHELIDNEILMQRAEKLGLLATDEQVDGKVKELKAPYAKEEFDQRMKERGITLDDFRRDLRRSLTIDKVLQQEIISKINVTDHEVSAYYDQHKAEFNLIEPQYHMAQILISAQPNPQVRTLDKAQNEAGARKKAQMIMNRLNSGEDFAAVAGTYSEQPETSANGGDLGFVPESSLKSDRQAVEAISRLQPGQYTQPLAAPGPNPRQIAGYRILRLISREPAGQRDLRDPKVHQAIRSQLRERREQLLRAAYYERMHNSASIENYLADEILKSAGSQ